MSVKSVLKGKKIHFIGIGGISMSALAAFLFTQGFFVTGSDAVKSETVEKLRAFSIPVSIGEDENSGWVKAADTVVYTDAISLENKELALAVRLKKRILKRAELLGKITAAFPYSLSVAGSHGKTTCTAMCAHIFEAAKVPFTAFIGGDDRGLSNFSTLGNEYLVTEACEYKKNLLYIPSKIKIVLNIDKDHMECYRDFSEVKETFRNFLSSAETAVVCADDPHLIGVDNAVTFGIENPEADYLAKNLKNEKERYSFTVYEFGKRLCRIRLRAVGRCNVYNALAAFAATRLYGFSVQEIKRGLESFLGVKRRFEEIGRIYGALAVCDYAHHPREIRSTIETAKRLCDGKLFVVFQPHTYSRTKALMEEFISVLSEVERLMIYKTFPAREKFDEEGSAACLAGKLGGCLYAESITALSAWLKRTVKENDCVLFLGAGDIYYLAKYLVNGVKGK